MVGYKDCLLLQHLPGEQVVSWARRLQHTGKGEKNIWSLSTGFHDMEEFNVHDVIKCHKVEMQFQFYCTLQTTRYELREWWWCVALVSSCWIEDERALKAS